MQRFSDLWETVCNLIIRPKRAEYEVDALGPEYFRLRGRNYQRHDIDVLNPRGMVLKCSHFEPCPEQRPVPRMPVVIYLHGNCGCRLDGLEYVAALLPQGFTVFTLDFSGSGHSEGDYVTLGFYECQDLAAVVDHLLLTRTVSAIALWGRSMGAVTAIMYGCRDTTIAAIVADSPFASLEQLMVELARETKPWVPPAAINLGIRALRSSILQRAEFPIEDLNTTAYAQRCLVPILLAHAQFDDFIGFHHSEAIWEAYRGHKRLLRFPGDHNSERPADFMAAALRFLRGQVGADPEPADPAGPGLELSSSGSRPGSEDSQGGPLVDDALSIDSIVLTTEVRGAPAPPSVVEVAAHGPSAPGEPSKVTWQPSESPTSPTAPGDGDDP